MVELIKRYKWWLFGIILLGGLVGLFQRRWSLREHRYDEIILAAAAKYDVDPALVKAVVWQESRFDARAHGRSGEIGLMQIMSATAEDWATFEGNKAFRASRLYDPAENVQCGAWYLKRLLRRYRDTDDSLVYALAAYNAGPSTIAKWSKGAGATNSAEFLKQMDYPGTKKYVGSVLKRYQFYRARQRIVPARTGLRGLDGSPWLEFAGRFHPVNRDGADSSHKVRLAGAYAENAKSGPTRIREVGRRRRTQRSTAGRIRAEDRARGRH